MVPKATNADKVKLNRRKINPEVLNHLIEAQNIIFNIPTQEKIASFYVKLLHTVPGVISCRVCFGKIFSQKGEIDTSKCKNCEFIKPDANINLMYFKDYDCKYSQLSDTLVYKVDSINSRYGYIILKISELSLFNLYKPFLINLNNFIALLLENRLQKSELNTVYNNPQKKTKEFFSKLHLPNLYPENKKEQEQIKNTLTESEEHFRYLFETMVQGVVFQDDESRIVKANQAACEILGLTMEQLLGKTTFDPKWKLIHEDGSTLNPQEMPSNIALKTGKPIKDKLIGAYIPVKNTFRWILTSSTPKFKNGQKRPYITMTTFTDITERKLAEQERLSNFWFFESMNKINKAIHRTNDLEKMMSDVLDEVLSIYDCDRAYLLYPCDPKADTWQVPMERNKTEYPGVLEQKLEMPVDEDVAKSFQILLDSQDPVMFGPGNQYPLPDEVSKKFKFKSYMAMAIYPKVGKPWQFGIHQCSGIKNWNKNDQKLFMEIGRRLVDGLSSLLSYTNVLENEQRYRMVFENSPVSIWEEDFSEVKSIFDELKSKGINDIEAYFNQHPEIIPKLAKVVRIVDVNQSTVNLYEAQSKQEFLSNVEHTITPEALENFRYELEHLWNKDTMVIGDSIIKTLKGNTRYVTTYLSVCPGFEKTLSKIIVSIVDITVLRQTEKKIMENEERLQLVLKSANIGLFDFNIKKNTLEVDDIWLEILGYSPGEIKINVDTWWSWIHPEDQLKQAKAFEDHVAGRNPYYHLDEYRARGKSGDWIWLMDHGKVVEYDLDGNPLRLVGIHLNITERKENIKKIHESEERYHLVFENSPVSIWEEDFSEVKSFFDELKSKGINDIEAYFNQHSEIIPELAEAVKIVDVNRSALILHKAETKEELMANLNSTFTPESYQIFRKELVHIWNGDTEMISDTVVKTLDGENRHVTIYFTICPGYERTLSKVIVSLIDITERKQSEEALKISETRFKDLFNRAAVPLCFINKKNGELIINLNFEQIFGYKAQEIPTMDKWWEMAYPDIEYRKWMLATYDAALQKAEANNIDLEPIEYRVTCKNGSVLNMVVFGSAIGEYYLLTFFDITDRIKAKEKLIERDEFLTSIIENIPDMIFIKDAKDYSFVRVNKAGEELLGLQRDVLIGKTDFDFFPTEQAQFFIDNDKKVLRNRKMIDIPEEVIKTKNGERILHTKKLPIYDNKGKPAFLLGISKDITEHKLAEEAIREQSRIIDAMFNQSVTPFVLYDKNWKFIRVNDAYAKYYNKRPVDFVGRFYAEIHPKQNLNELKDVGEILRKQKKPVILPEHPYIFDEFPERGTTYWDMVLQPLLNENGEVTYIFFSSIEVTERKRTAEKVLRSEQRLRLHSEQSPLGFLEWDVNFRAVEWNKACEKIFGYTREEAIGKHAKELLLPPEVHELVDGIYKDLMNLRGGQHSINKNITKDGRTIICEWYNTTLVDKDGNAIGVASICNDITKQKKLEEELATYREHLEDVVEKRTIALESINKELESFSYSVSHDLRAPLRSIDGFSQILLEEYSDKLDTHGQNYLNRVRNGAQRMSQLIDDLLNLSRVTRSEINLREINLSDILQEIVEDLLNSNSKRIVNFNIQKGIIVKADERLLRIAMQNLMDNAWKFTSKKQSSCIEFGMISKEQRSVYFIRDNGVGFDVKYAHKMFGAFQRLHSNKEYSGTGIGLATVQRIIYRHGGKVWAESEINKGAIFYFTIP